MKNFLKTIAIIGAIAGAGALVYVGIKKLAQMKHRAQLCECGCDCDCDFDCDCGCHCCELGEDDICQVEDAADVDDSVPDTKE